MTQRLSDKGVVCVNPIDDLLEGYRHFRDQYFKQEPELFAKLAKKGQTPAVAVIACCDSRVDPAIILNCEPGDLFIIRNVANLVPPYEPDGRHHGTSAALEFAVCGLNVAHIIVVGHAQCGGIQALLRGAVGTNPGDFVASWMSIAAAARYETLNQPTLSTQEERARYCEQAAIRASLKNLLSFPWIAERASQGCLQCHGWYFDIGTGDLLKYDTVLGQFSAQI